MKKAIYFQLITMVFVVAMLVMAVFMMKSMLEEKNDELTGMIVGPLEGSHEEAPQDEGPIEEPEFSVK